MQTTAPAPAIVLASASPRRKSLLEGAGLRFAVVPSRFDESAVPVSSPETYVRVQAEGKAADVSGRYPDAWVIGADTIVVIDGEILGKPASPAAAREMLVRLSGRRHAVYTGYALFRAADGDRTAGVVATEVAFKPLTGDEIDWYINSGEPFDKAGAYAIQGLGSRLVLRINGSYTNVVGLPVCEVVADLMKRGAVQRGDGDRHGTSGKGG